MNRALLIALVAPLVAACGAVFRQDALSVSVQNADGGEFRQGHVHTVAFTVTNTSQWPLLLGDIEPVTNEDETWFHFQRKYYGSASTPTETHVTYNPNAQQATAAIFNEGFLMPGQSLTFQKTHRIITQIEDIKIHYTVIDTPRGMGDVTTRLFLQQGGATTYVKPTTEQLDAYAAGSYAAVTETTAPSPRAVVFPVGQYGVVTNQPGLLYRTDKVEVSFAPKLLAETRKAASVRVGVSEYNLFAFSEALNAWIARRGSDRIVVPQGGGETWLAPDAHAQFYKDVDHTGEALLSVDDPSPWASTGFKVSEGDPQYNPGLKFVHVTREKLADFLKHDALKARGQWIEPKYYFFDKHYFVIAKP